MVNIANIESDPIFNLAETMTDMSTLTPETVARISERMVEVDRANKTLGRKNTQTTNQLMTLNMLSAAPYRRLRQCLAQIESRRKAIEQHYWDWKESDIKYRELRESEDELSQIQADRMDYGRGRMKIYIEGAFKELAVFQEAYEEIRKNFDIPEDWDEEAAEMDEIHHHIKQAFRQAHRDMVLQGSITQGNAEYLEQYGIHLQTARKVIGQYIASVEKMIQNGDMPSVNHLYEFLDNVVELFGEEYKNVLAHIGVDNLVIHELLYRSTGDLS